MPLDPSRLLLYLVADPDLVDSDLLAMVTEAIEGGVTCVQLRAKGRTDREVERLAGAMAVTCRDRGVLSLVNDRVDIALACGADGVHLGVDDLSIEAARRLGGDRLVVGYSPETDEQAARAVARGADYLGVGPVFATGSKADAGLPIGVDGLRRRITAAGLPAVGIGGITAENASVVTGAGASGVAVVSAISRAAEPRAAARALRAAVVGGR